MTSPARAGSRPSSAAIIRASDIGTVVIVVSAVATLLLPDPLNVVVVVVSCILFVLGCAAFLWALAIAADRSRTDAIDIGGTFLLLGTAPRPIQWRLLGALGIQVVVTVASAAARPFTNQAFTVLGAMFGLGLTGLWGARFGTFGPRRTDDDDS